MRSRRALLACLLAAGTGLGALGAASPFAAVTDAAASTRPMALAGSAAPAIPAGSTRIGTLPAGQRLTVDVTLSLRNRATLAALQNGLADADSPYYHHFLTPAQFDAAFGPTGAQVAQVDSALRSAGLTPGQPAADHLSIPVTATVAQLQKAFGITLATYRVPGGRVAYANTAAPKFAGDVAGIVQGVAGLDDLTQAHSLDVPAARAAATDRRVLTVKQALAAHPALAGAGPVACSDGASVPKAFPLNLLGDIYGFGQLWNQNDLGAGQRIAIMEFAPAPVHDINVFRQCYGVSNEVKYHLVDGGPASNAAGADEVALDVEILSALAPKAAIDVYLAPNSNKGFLDILSKFVSPLAGDPLDNTLAISWGGCEALGKTSAPFRTFLGQQEQYYQKANGQGQTVLAATGDTGSTGCDSPANPASLQTQTSVWFPASSPYVTAVGGTTFLTNDGGQTIFEGVYNESAKQEGATGGGPSSGWCMLPYQYRTPVPGLTTAHYTSSTCPASTGHLLRRTADVSANADPETGYGIYYNGGWLSYGGTSASAQLWAAYAALTDASPYCKALHQAGALPQVLYSVAATRASTIYNSGNVIFDDIVPAGGGWPDNNDYTPSGYQGGNYPVTAGYDLPTGLGTPAIWGAAPSPTALTYPVAACQQVTVSGVYQTAGRANTPGITAVISGAGFSKTVSQDKVRVYQGSTVLATLTPMSSPPNPNTFTRLTVVLPKESARTVDLRVSVNGGAYSAVVAADRFTYANAPHISSISPAKGSRNGGTTVTIHGSNFVNVTSVTFGGKAGTKLAVSGTGTLTIVAPAHAAGAVKIVISAAGGTSNSVTYTFT